ncbi:hypothetical protein ABZ153_18260 [Streptomyces sp. NPDC006290]|uniref:hypothetical protein n=1 Tax=Streptomyces sp. NPDC006290 TaxID=3156745 RepID=UPI0033A0BF05
MIHGVRLEGGRAVSYLNRRVRTRSFTDGARTYDGQGHRDLTADPANTHVIRHAGRTLAPLRMPAPAPGPESDTTPGGNSSPRGGG